MKLPLSIVFHTGAELDAVGIITGSCQAVAQRKVASAIKQKAQRRRERAIQEQAFSRPKCITAANQITTNSSYNNNNNNQGNSSNGSHSFIRSFVQYQQILHQQYRQQQ
uniref:Uncharacterized protein n=1 Tax=Glossina palpalis gambiensis TaxID=67801 RepID=A0A1B0BFR0_9MUSC